LLCSSLKSCRNKMVRLKNDIMFRKARYSNLNE
jgi:hypothetical protein